MATRNKVCEFMSQVEVFIAGLYLVIFGWLQWWTGVFPLLTRGSEERVHLQQVHLTLGATAFVLLFSFLLVWALNPCTPFTTKIRNCFQDSGATALALLFALAVPLILFGLSQAGSKGEDAAAFGVFDLPSFLSFSQNTSGYMHSVFSSMSKSLFECIVFVYLFQKLRPFVRAEYALIGLMVLHLLLGLPKPAMYYPIAVFAEYVYFPFIYLLALGIYTWANNRKWIYLSTFGIFIVFFLHFPFLFFGVAPPWHKAEEVNIVYMTPELELPAIRSRTEIFPDEKTLLEAKKAATICLACHTFNKEGDHLLGPNLAGIFNRQAGTIADYDQYSVAMRKKGMSPLFWTRDNLKAYLNDSQSLVPGNLMVLATVFPDPQSMALVLDYLEYISAD